MARSAVPAVLAGVVLTVGLLLTADARATPPPEPLTVQFGAGFTTGTWRAGEDDAQQRKMTGGRGFADIRIGPWRISGGGRVLAQTVDEDGDPRDGEVAASTVAGVLGGYDHRWFHLALGLGAGRGLRDDGEQPAVWFPAGRLRIGPRDVVFADVSVLDLTAWSPGPGIARAGVGTSPGEGLLWVGGVWDEACCGVGVAGGVPMGDGFSLFVDAAMHPTRPASMLMLEAGVSITFANL